MELENSKRVMLKASYVEIELTPEEEREMNRIPTLGLEKINFLHTLNLSREEMEIIRRNGPDMAEIVSIFDHGRRGKGGNLALAGQLARIPNDLFIQLGRELAERRQDAVTPFIVQQFERRVRVAPVGRLHLERVEMVPAGTERGELIYTVPLTPNETVTVSHKEWATTKDEYESIVQDSFESYSERGVAEKTDASMSAENEKKHSSSFEFSAVTKAGYGPVSVSLTTGLKSSAEDRESLKWSTQQTREITAKSSARARQEHKVSVKLEQSRGTEDTSFRTITNPHADKALRVDYYRMMRKWRVDLYRYGLRLTYDIMVPLPALRLWRHYRRLEELDRQIRTPFSFDLAPEDITDSNWTAMQKEYQVPLEPPPPQTRSVQVNRRFAKDRPVEEIIEFVAPDGYVMTDEIKGGVVFDLPAGNLPDFRAVNPLQLNSTSAQGYELTTKGIAGGGRMAFPFMRTPQVEMQISLTGGARRTTQAYQDWQRRVWQTLHDTRFARYQHEQERLRAERDRLWSYLAGGDTLTLRRMEREELMRCVLTWLIGPTFDPAPNDISLILKSLLFNDKYREETADKDEQPTALDFASWSMVRNFGDIVKFIHQAIEWENLLYFLYPYFWGSDDLAHEKLFLEHPDSAHRDFLRSGFARVVVPIRPGFEEAFVRLTTSGSPGSEAPYLTIASEIQSFARTNYGSIPPANPEKHSRPLLYTQQRKTWEIMQTVMAKIEEYYAANQKYPASLNQLPGGPFKDAWGRDFVYKVPGAETDYELYSLGADGAKGGTDENADISATATASLVGTWSEYTPTSGIDIDIKTIPL